VILGADDKHVQFVVEVVALQIALVGGAGGGHHVLAAQIVEAVDAAVLGGQQLPFDIDKTVGKRDLFLPLGRHSGGAALKINRAVLHQRNPRLRCHQVVLHLQLRQRQLLLDALDDLARQLHRIPHRLPGVIAHIRERHRRIAISQSDAVGAGDLAERAGQRHFIGLCLSAYEQRQCAAEQRDFLHCYSPLWVGRFSRNRHAARGLNPCRSMDVRCWPISSLSNCPLPQARVKPSAPWPRLSHRLR